MSIVFYEAPQSSATPVSWALAELAVPHERVRLDLRRGESHTPQFLAINPHGKVPTLVVDGTPMFEALAIMLWLADRHGVDKGLWPAPSDPRRLQAIAWSTWAYVSWGAGISRLCMATSDRMPAALRNQHQAKYVRAEMAGMLEVLDAQLSKQACLIGAEFSIADLIVAGAVGFGLFSGVPVGSNARVAAWLARCQARPCFRALS